MSTAARQPVHDRTKREHIARVDHVKFHKEEDGYTVVGLSDSQVAKGTADLDTLAIGDTFRFLGRWDEHDIHGAFFRFETYVRHEPATRAAVIKYLSKHCDDIGEKKASRLYDAYGAGTCSKIRTETARVVADGLLSEQTALAAADTLQKMAAFEETKLELFGMFDGRGFPGSLIDQCIEKWGVRAPEVIRRNPFTMLVRSLPGCGFRRCDRLWLDLKLPKNALKRQMICGWSAIRSATSDGHTWHDSDIFIKEIHENISGATDPIKALRFGIRAGWIARKYDDKVKGKLWVAEAEKAKAEKDVARHVERLLAGGDAGTLWPAAPLPGIDEKRTPSDHQNAVWDSIRLSPLAMLTGGPGTGKTFTVASVLRQIVADHGLESVAVCAPTGKAAVRCSQALKSNGVDLRARTIHSLLGIRKAGYGGERWAFEYCERNPMPYRFVVVDETSMVDADLMADLLAACATPSPIPGRPARQLESAAVEPPRCLRCHRELEDPASWAIGYGPTCARIVPKCAYREVHPKEISQGETLPAVPPIPVAGTHVLLVGDPDQLPPVGHGAPLRDLITAGIPTGRLTEIHRNAGTIVHVCAAIRDGKPVKFDEKFDFDALPPKNCRFIETADDAETAAVIQGTLANMRTFNPVWQTQLIVPLNVKSDISRKPMNEKLQRLLNPEGRAVEHNPFRLDDKVICLRNTWLPIVALNGIYRDEQGETDPASYFGLTDDDGEPVERYTANGEIGRVVAIAPKILVVRFNEDDELVRIILGKKKPEDADGRGDEDAGMGGNYDCAYAITVHKSQGSETPLAIIVVDKQAGRIASRNLWYTGLSRGAKAVLVVGDRAVFERQRKKNGLRRKTFLTETLRSLLSMEAK
jgi:hypothetical protein